MDVQKCPQTGTRPISAMIRVKNKGDAVRYARAILKTFDMSSEKELIFSAISGPLRMHKKKAMLVASGLRTEIIIHSRKSINAKYLKHNNNEKITTRQVVVVGESVLASQRIIAVAEIVRRVILLANEDTLFIEVPSSVSLDKCKGHLLDGRNIILPNRILFQRTSLYFKKSPNLTIEITMQNL